MWQATSNMQWQTEQHLHESSVINTVIKRQNKQHTTYDKGWLGQTTTGNNYGDQGFQWPGRDDSGRRSGHLRLLNTPILSHCLPLCKGTKTGTLQGTDRGLQVLVTSFPCVISGFRREADENSALLVRNYHYSMGNSPEGRSSHLRPS